MHEQTQTPNPAPVTPPEHGSVITPSEPAITTPATPAEPAASAPVTPSVSSEPAVTPASTPAPAPAATTPEPTSPAPAATPDSATLSAAPGKVNKQRILLVEDDDSLAQVYQTRLDAEGFTVQRVPNGEDALVSALNFKPDLILLDVMMPKVSGFDVLDILRNTPETAKVKVIMLTALGQDSDKERAASLGVDEYLVKSQVVIADVVDRIKQHLNLS